MQITRSGHGAYHGHTSIDLSGYAQWAGKSGSVEFIASGVKDFSTSAHHDYCISMDLTEIARALRVLAKAAEDGTDRDAVSQGLSSSLHDLLILATAVSATTRR